MVRPVRASLAAFALFLFVVAPAAGQDRAQEVLAQARAAMGIKGDAAPVASLAVGATVRRVVPAVNMEMNSDVQLEFLFPDKYRRTENITIGPVSRTISTGINGADLLYDDGGIAAITGVDPKTPGPTRDNMIKGMKEDAFRMAVIALLAPPPSMTCTVTSAGVAEAPDGKADVVDIKGPDKLNLRLFLDTTSHQLLLATFQVESIDADQMKALTQKAVEKAKADPANASKVAQEMRDEAEKLPKKLITVQMHFSEPKAIGGVTLASKMNVEGLPQGAEEWTFSSFKLNPTLKPERFAK
jgi:hypothetical protein